MSNLINLIRLTEKEGWEIYNDYELFEGMLMNIHGNL